MIISFLQKFCRPLFGSFEPEEFKKFLRMGLIFTCILGGYWTLRVLKNSIFSNLVSCSALPWAKTVSLILLVPLIMLYSKLLDRYSREKMFYFLSYVYGLATIVFAVLLAMPSIGQASCEVIAARTGLALYGTNALAYLFYFFVESYGSLLVALFWAIASDTTSPDSAKKGFSLVVAIGQLGGIVAPYLITKLPGQLGLTTSAFSVFVCAGITLALVYLFRHFLTATPKQLLISFHGKNEAHEAEKQEPGFFEGLRLLVSNGYLLGIFAVLAFFEIIVSVFDMHFQTLAATHYSGLALAEYQGLYGTSVNFVALLCLLLGVSNITRFLGVGVSLMLMPLIIACAIFGFLSLNSLTFLFILMVCSKALNYALNGPAVKQLYIPTTHDVRFKAQAWIETFGSRASKELGALFNMLLGPLQKSMGTVAGRAYHVLLSSYGGFAIVIAWFFIALFLGKTYKKAIESKKVVC
jgi:ATP:ADP antiporter, AAA family